MTLKQATWFFSALLFFILFCIKNRPMINNYYDSLQNNINISLPNNIFETLEKPIIFLLQIQHLFTSIRTLFCQWHESVFYYAVDNTGNQKKMFLSARILTAIIPWALISTIICTNPYILGFIWHLNYASLTSIPSTITPALVAQKIGTLSSFNQNCIMIGAEKGLLWVMSRKIAPDICINPATWFTDPANHDFINTITSFLVIVFSWIYILYCVYLNSSTQHNNLIKIILFQLCIRYALYLANLKNNIHSLVFSEHLGTYVKNTGDKLNLVHYAMQKELINAIENVNKTLKKIVHDVQ